MQSSEIKNNIMRRVYTVYLFKSVAQPLLIELLLIAVFIAMATLFVSIRNILMNVYSLHDIEALGKFMFSAFMNTQVVVKTIIIGVGLTGLIFIGDSFRRIRRALQYRT
ncbi:MAG: hypothetical protein M3Q73_00120 [bacterium]|nr:hypothetical protein [bacterium]